MHFAVVGAGAVGGFCGALLARAGSTVSFVARGAHLEAMRRDGLRIIGPVGDFTVEARAERDPAGIGPVDVVVLTVKTYDNETVLPMLPALVGPETVVLTLQNGVDSAHEVASVVGEAATLAGPIYVSVAVEAPGVIRQTGTFRRLVFGECFGDRTTVSERVRAIHAAMAPADILIEAVPDARAPLWEKLVHLAPFAAFTTAARLPIGALLEHPDLRETFLQAVDEVEAVGRASGVSIEAGARARVETFAAGIPPTTRSSMLVDLLQGKRIEVESVIGSVVRRGAQAGVETPTMAALYAVLKPYATGPR
jgi:2-dehydropantoate 2-reductase